MSIDTTPPGGGPSPPPPINCVGCFPDGTPDTIWFSLQGMQRGDLWLPGDPNPPNGNVAMRINAPCNWTCDVGGCRFTYQVTRATTKFTAQILGGPIFFFAQIGNTCAFWAVNTLNNPAVSKLYGGWVTAVPEFAGVPFSIPELMSLMSDEIYWAQWLMPRPMAAENVVYGLYNLQGQTNVRIKIDHS